MEGKQKTFKGKAASSWLWQQNNSPEYQRWNLLSGKVSTYQMNLVQQAAPWAWSIKHWASEYTHSSRAICSGVAVQLLWVIYMCVLKGNVPVR